MVLRQLLPTIHEGEMLKEVPQNPYGRSKIVQGRMTKEKRATFLSVRKRNSKSYRIIRILNNTNLDAELEKRGIFSPHKTMTSVENSQTTKHPLLDTEGKQKNQLAQPKSTVHEESKLKKRSSTRADSQKKPGIGESKEGAKKMEDKEGQRSLDFLTAVQQGKLSDDEYKQQLQEIYQDTLTRYAKIKPDKDRHLWKMEMPVQKPKPVQKPQKVLKFESLGQIAHPRSASNDKLQLHPNEKKTVRAGSCDQYKRISAKDERKGEKAVRFQEAVVCDLEKTSKNEVKTERHTKKEDNTEHHGGNGKEVPQKRVKSAEEIEVKALDVWSAGHDKKDKIQPKEKVAEEINGKTEKVARKKEDLCEDTIKIVVEHKEKENPPRKRLQLLEEILKETTTFESSGYDKNRKPGRKERNDHAAISEQIFDMKMSRGDQGMQKTPNQPGHVTIPKTREQSQKQMYNAPVMNTQRGHVTVSQTREESLKQTSNPPVMKTELRRPVVKPNVLAQDQKALHQPAHGPVNFPARPNDSPYVADIRQRGMKILHTHQQATIHQKKPVPVFPTKQSIANSNLPDIYGSNKKQSYTDASISPSLDQFQACSEKRFCVYDKSGSTKATQIYVPSVSPTAKSDQFATKTPPAGKIPSPVMKIPQSSGEMKKCLQASKHQTKCKVVSVDRPKDVLVISQSRNEKKTVSINCSAQRKAENGRPVLRSGNTNKHGNSQNFSAHKTMISKGSQEGRKLSRGQMR